MLGAQILKCMVIGKLSRFPLDNDWADDVKLIVLTVAWPTGPVDGVAHLLGHC